MALTRRATIAAAAGLALAAPSALAAPAAPGDMTLGRAQAPVHVVEYLSLTCPHCAEFNETVFPALKAKYVDTGKVRWTFRELLTAPTNVAAAGFLMARCAGPGKYFKVVDEVLRSQSRWQSGNIKPIFLEIAQANGLSEAQFEACISDEAAQAALNARLKHAVEVDKISSTPSFFINGKRLDGVPDLARFEALLAEAAKAPSPSNRRR